MIETFLWQFLVLAVTCMLHPIVFIASLLLLIVEELQLLSMAEALIPTITSLLIPSVTILNVSAYTTIWMEQGGIIVMIIILLLIVIPLCCYLFFVGGCAPGCVNSLRLQQLTNAMMLVYGIVLFLAAVKLLSFAIPVGIISTATIFVLSFVLLKKTRLPLFVVMGIGILIAILLI